MKEGYKKNFRIPKCEFMNTISLQYYLITILFLFFNCFGSEGNSIQEKGIVLSRIMDIYNTSDSELKTSISFSDDQGDDSLNIFQIVSQGVTYEVNLDSNSTKLNSLIIDYYLEKPNMPFSITKHSEDSPVSSNSTNFQNVYSHKTNEDVFFASSPNSVEETGSVYKYSPKSNVKLKRGTLTKIVLEPSTLVLSGKVTATKIVSFLIEIQNPTMELVLNCKIGINPTLFNQHSLQFKFSSLLKDTKDSSIIGTIHTLGNSSSSMIINSTTYPSIITEIKKNLSSVDLLKENTCVP
jgi:hypothetical protein